MHELARLKRAFARDQMRQKRVARDVERHAEKDVGRALIELARQPAIRDIELEQAMAGRKLHALDLGHVPGRNHETARVRVAADFVEDPGDLVVGASVRSFPGAPLLAVDGTEVAVRVGPFVPDRNAMRLEIGDVGVAAQEPDELAHDRLEMQLLGGDERKALPEIEPELPAEQRAHAGSGAVHFDRAVVKRLAHEIEIGLHGRAVLFRLGDRSLYNTDSHFRARRKRVATAISRGQCRVTVSSSFSQALAIAASLESVIMIGDPSAPSSANNFSPGRKGGAWG